MPDWHRQGQHTNIHTHTNTQTQKHLHTGLLCMHARTHTQTHTHTTETLSLLSVSNKLGDGYIVQSRNRLYDRCACTTGRHLHARAHAHPEFDIGPQNCRFLCHTDLNTHMPASLTPQSVWHWAFNLQAIESYELLVSSFCLYCCPRHCS